MKVTEELLIENKAEIGKRLVKIRAGTNQAEFAEKLNIDRSMVSRWENGISALTKKNFDYIRMVFGINEDWLLIGQGEMFITKDLAETPEEKELLGIFRRLSAEMRDFFLDMGRKLAKTGTKQAEIPGADAFPNTQGSTTSLPEVPQKAKPASDTEKGESPRIGPSPKNGETG
jgi:transcriptional regulator with XRE-family HTH domain